MSASRESTSNISQAVINQKISQYLKITNDEQETFEDGKCCGYCVVAMYSKWLELNTLLKNNTKSRDDWPWMEEALIKIANWDGTVDDLNNIAKENSHFISDFDRLIQLIFFYQSPDLILHTSQLQTEQHLQDTLSRKFIREYSIAAILNKNDFTNTISIETNKLSTFMNEVMQENRLVFICSIDHLVGVIKYKHEYYFYDANGVSGWQTFQMDGDMKLASAILTAFVGTDLQAHDAIGFYSLRHEELAVHPYPKRKTLLAAVNMHRKWIPYMMPADASMQKKCFRIATEIGCVASLNFYFDHNNFKYPDYHFFIRKYLEPEQVLILAVTAGHFAIAKKLLAFGVSPNDVDASLSALSLAIKQQRISLIKLLIANNADLHEVNSQGDTLLHQAVQTGNLAVVKILMLKGADFNIKNNNDCSALHWAMLYRNVPIVEYFLTWPSPALDLQAYEYLVCLHWIYPENQIINYRLTNMLPTLSLCREIKNAMQDIEAENNHYFNKIMTSLEATATNLIASELTPEERAVKLLTIMMPQLHAYRSSKWWHLFSTPLNTDGIYQCAGDLGITHEVINSAQMALDAKVFLLQFGTKR